MEIDTSILRIVSDFSIAASLMPILIATGYFKYMDKIILPLYILIIVSGSVDILNKIYMDKAINNSYIFHLFTIIEFFLISLFYFRFFKQYLFPHIILFFTLAFLIGIIIDYKMNGLNSMDSFSISMESLIFSFYSLFLFYFILKNLIFENLLNSSVFWFNSAVLFYFSGNLILFIFSNYVMAASMKVHYILWALIHSFFNIVFNLFLSIGFWKAKIR